MPDAMRSAFFALRSVPRFSNLIQNLQHCAAGGFRFLKSAKGEPVTLIAPVPE